MIVPAAGKLTMASTEEPVRTEAQNFPAAAEVRAVDTESRAAAVEAEVG